MVVVSGTWVKNVVSFPINGDLITTVKMAAKAVLICRPNSHPFQERTLSLDQPVKIGRSVARARAVPNNAIFDCKVLSRNHALLWYENGKFYLQDTKSSNGTFVNNQRLSKGAEESPPREVCSGDIVQFGVDVMENARKVTHGCIVATVKLYLPDGKEAKASPSTSVVSSVGLVPLEDLYQLNMHLQEALQREHQLESKLAALQKIVDATRGCSESAWKALIDEDRLLSRVATLENQLQLTSKNTGEDNIRDEIKKLLEEKEQYQILAKEKLQKILQEKLEAERKLEAAESSLRNSESEYTHQQQLCAQSQQDLQELAQKHTAQVQKFEELLAKMQESDDKHREMAERLEQEKLELQQGLEAQTEHSQELQMRLDAFQADGNLSHQRMADIHSQLELLKTNEENEGDVKEGLDKNIGDTEHGATDVILQCLEPALSKNEKDELDDLRSKLKASEEELLKYKDMVAELQLLLDNVRSDEEENVTETLSLQERLEEISVEIDIGSPEIDTNKSAEGDVPSSQMSRLKAEQNRLLELLEGVRNKKKALEESKEVWEHDLNAANTNVKMMTEEVNIIKQHLLAAQTLVHLKNQKMMEMENKMQEMKASLAEYANGLGILQEKIRDETQRANKLEASTENLRQQVMDANQSAKRYRNEGEQLKDRLKAANATHAEATKAADTQMKLELDTWKARHSAVENDLANARIELSAVDTAAKKREAELLRRLDEAGVPREVNTEQLEEELVEIKTNFMELVSASERLTQEFEAYRAANPAALLRIIEMADRLPLVVILIILFAIGCALYLS